MFYIINYYLTFIYYNYDYDICCDRFKNVTRYTSRQVTPDLLKMSRKNQISIHIMLWLDKMDHMTHLARQRQITDWTLDDDWSNGIT